MIRKLHTFIICLCMCLWTYAQEGINTNDVYGDNEGISIDDVDGDDIIFTEQFEEITLIPIDFTGLNTFDERFAKVDATCGANTFYLGTKVSFDVSACSGPILLSPYINRSLLSDPTVATGDERVITWPYKFQFNFEGTYYVHCGTQFKNIATCIRILDPGPIPTLSTWSTIILSLLFVTIAFVKIQFEYLNYSNSQTTVKD